MSLLSSQLPARNNILYIANGRSHWSRCPFLKMGSLTLFSFSVNPETHTCQAKAYSGATSFSQTLDASGNLKCPIKSRKFFPPISVIKPQKEAFGAR